VGGLEDLIAIERKSLPDLIGCIGVERERFERELKRMLAYPVRAVVVEATWADLHAGQWRSKVTPAAAMGSVLGWVAEGVPFLLVGDHAEAGRVVARMLFIAARRAWRQLQAFQVS
jgi:ERCC4-type nuclease